MKILLWFVSGNIEYLNGAIQILERQHNGLEIIGTTAHADVPIFKDGKKVNFIPIDKVDRGGGVFDILLVVGARQIGMSEITKVARQLKFDTEKLLGDWIVCLPGFTLQKYRQLQRSRLSIFASQCFGGIISHTLGLPFRSPFVNLFCREFIRFLRAPRVYMEEQLVFKETAWQSTLKFDYPIFTLGNVDIHMNHYRDFDEAVKVWEHRKTRINWFNLFVTMYTEDEKILREFDALPFGKKVCFVPFKSDLDSAWYINREIDKSAKIFGENINNFGFGNFFYYDPFDMLLYGKKTRLIEM